MNIDFTISDERKEKIRKDSDRVTTELYHVVKNEEPGAVLLALMSFFQAYIQQCAKPMPPEHSLLFVEGLALQFNDGVDKIKKDLAKQKK